MDQKKLYRSKRDRMLFGVAGGLAEYFGIDSTIVRIVFVVLTIWGGVGLILYIIGIFLIPENSKEAEPKHSNSGKNRVVEERVNAVAAEVKEKIKEQRHRRGALTGEQIFGLIVLLVGIIFLSNTLFSFVNFWRLWPIVLIILGLIILLGRSKEV